MSTTANLNKNMEEWYKNFKRGLNLNVCVRKQSNLYVLNNFFMKVDNHDLDMTIMR